MAEPRQNSSCHTGPAPERVFRPAERLAELNRYFAQARARVQPVGEGNGHAFGQPAAAPGGLGGGGEDPDTSYHVEALYRLQLNENIAITPGLLVILNPEHNDANDTIYVGTLRTTFTF